MDGRFNADGSKKYTIEGRPISEGGNEVEALWDHHREIVRLLALGYRATHISQAIGVHPQTVSNVRNDPIAQAQIRELQGFRDDETGAIAKRVRQMAPLAIDIIESSLELAEENIEDDKIRADGIRASRTVLEHAIPKKIEGAHIVGHITLSQINEMKERVAKAVTIEAVPVEEVE